MPDPSLTALQRRLVALRALRGFKTREPLVEDTGVADATLKDWELGRFGSRGPGVLDLIKLAKFYGVSLDWLLGLTDDQTALPPGYHMVDDGLVERIREAEKLSDLGKHVHGKGTVLWGIVIPRLRRILHPEDPELAALDDELRVKLDRLRAESQGD